MNFFNVMVSGKKLEGCYKNIVRSHVRWGEER